VKPRPKHRARRTGTPKRATNDPRRGDGKRKNGFRVVGIGASAGGYEAFTKVLEKLPARNGMALVFVQHLDPTHESRLSELLRRSTPLSVIEVRKPVKVEPNHLYVIPPNRNLTIERGRLQPTARRKGEMPPMPVDSFFRSLAEDQGQNAIGIILSGNGADGTLGLEAIKGADGITFAQSPESAKYNGMPGSAIASGCVDFVLPPERMGRELGNLRRHSRLAAAQESRVEPGHPLPKIQSLLRSHNGVDFSAYKQTTLNRRILRRMVVHRLAKMDEYLAYLRGHPAELEALAEDVLITVTRFFRDRKSLEVLHKLIFPALMEGRAPGMPIRAWVPGCSSGEEVYSLAIMLAEFLGEKAGEYPVQMFGTDISESAIAKARAGVYRGNIAIDVSPERLRRFFSATDDGFRIAKAIRDQCVFARQDLTSDPPFSQLDLISCQNVLIYFGPELQRRVLPVFHYALKPHGYLALGSAESLSGLSELFRHVDGKHRIFQKRPVPRHGEAPFATRSLPPDIANHRELDPLEHEPVFPALEKVADRVVLQHCAPAGVVVDTKLQVLQFRGVTAPYLEHKPGAANLNLLKMLREELVVPVRTILAKAAKQQNIVRKDVVWPRAKDQHRHLHISVVPFKAPPHKEPLFLILFEEGARVDLPELKFPRGARSHPAKAGADREVQHLREELEVTRESLQAIIEEQEATNEELKSANEESQSTNEELQSTNEELETAKEEMQ
jgi:two-component system CheB/CheR fusion protein